MLFFNPFYSGKQKDHTHKNLVLSDDLRQLLVLSKTKPGRNHDYALFKELNPQIPSHIVNWVDARLEVAKEGFSNFGGS